MVLFDEAPFSRVLVVDFETAWASKTYTLSSMTTEEYIRDPRFHAWGLCWQEFGEGKPVWVAHDDVPAWVASVDWSRTAVLAHNALFDVSILSWVYGAKPAFIFDSLSMARALRGVEMGNSLAKLADTFGLPPKGRAVHSTDGVFGTLPAVVERELAAYCAHDVYLCSEVFSRLLMRVDDTGTPRGMYPIKELRLIDMTLKMYTQPHLELDGEMLEQALEEERTKREAVLGRLESMGLTESDLASNLKFAQALQMLGVEAPTKISKTTGKLTLALAKNDALFQALLNGDREDVALLCEARLKVKSTLERTRAQRFLDISKRGQLPVPLSYYGAHTGRWAACLVAETEVLVYDRRQGQRKKKIVDVLPDDLVWDGVEFVRHAGVKFSGYKEVITHDGVTGTPDHKVFIDKNTTLTLVEAASRKARIMDGAKPNGRDVESARQRVKRAGW